ncbi:MAG: hypothetical protein V9H25_16525 [Candidatus Competibacter sp.]
MTDTRSRELRGQFAGVRRALRLSEEERVLERFLEVVTQRLHPAGGHRQRATGGPACLGGRRGLFQAALGQSGQRHFQDGRSRELAIPLTTGIQKVFRQRQELRIFPTSACPRRAVYPAGGSAHPALAGKKGARTPGGGLRRAK